MKKQLNIIVCLVLILSSIAALNVSAQDDAAYECPTTGGTLITAITADPVSLNEEWLEVRDEGGIIDVKSRATGTTCHGVPYVDL